MNNNKYFQLPISIILSVISLFWLFLIPASHSNEITFVKTAVLFVAYDQGESNAFLRIQEKLKESNIPYRILAMGQAAEVFKDDPALILIPELTHNKAVASNRNHRLNQRTVYRLTEKIGAKVVYTGMASRAQAQVANVWERSGTKVIAFYDNFDPLDSVNYVNPFLEELRTVDEFHVPSKSTGKSFAAIAKSTNAKVVVTGQPTMEAWDKISEQTDKALLRETLNIAPQKKVVLFAGDYSNTYPEAFETFVKTTRMLPEVHFLVTYHPKFSGEYEKNVIESLAGSNVQLIHHNMFSTATLSTIASLVLVHKSSVAQQAVYQGKPVIYVAEEGYQNLLLTEQLAILATTAKPLGVMINAHLLGYRAPAVTEKLGIPDAPSKTIAKLMIDALRKK